jgi:hypothetical protein
MSVRYALHWVNRIAADASVGILRSTVGSAVWTGVGSLGTAEITTDVVDRCGRTTGAHPAGYLAIYSFDLGRRVLLYSEKS